MADRETRQTSKNTTLFFKTEESAKGFPQIDVSITHDFDYTTIEEAEGEALNLLKLYDKTYSELESRRKQRVG